MPKAVQIHISQPCHENWHNMTPKEQGRFCGSCEKIVVDFSKMSDKEMLNHLSKAVGQPVCGRFANDQLNRKIEPAINNKRFSPPYVWNLLLATALFFESCNDTTTGEVVCEKPAVQQLPVEDSTMSKPVVAEDTSRPIPLLEINEKILSTELDLSEEGMMTSGFAVMENDGVPITGPGGLPLWLKQNCFNKEK
jgi:hypothetical protein